MQGSIHSGRFALVLAVLLFVLNESAFAQLSEKLKAEDPQTLARDAVANGNAIRGAIIFPQHALACATCHVAGSSDLLGPDLTRIPKGRTNSELVESILHPSKVITKGFETTTIVTESGRTFSGRLLSKTDKKIVLRGNSEDRKRLTFRPNAIESSSTSPKSLMPDGLADKLKNRKEFLDLVRYLIDLRDSAAEPIRSNQRKQLEPHLQGLALANRFQCGNCHANDLISLPQPSRSGPNLDRLVNVVDPAYIQKFLTDPSHTKPESDMPDALASIPTEKRADVAAKLTHFLASKSDQEFQPRILLADDRVGRQLYREVGCTACHSPFDSKRDKQQLLTGSSVSLGRLPYSLAGLTSFLEDPLAIRPSGHMPNMKLNHTEAKDVASYLLSNADHRITGRFAVNAEMAKAGERLFEQLNCAACHGENDSARSSNLKTNPTLANLRLDHGCLSNDVGSWPKYSLTEKQAGLIRSTISHFRESKKPLASEQQIQLSMTSFRCTACHDRNSLGGVTDERNDYFLTTNPNLGPQGRIPPALTGVGAKLKPKWMREVLVSGRAIRPYLKTRMPQYGTNNVEHLIDLFQTEDTLPHIELPEIKGREKQKTMREAGVKLVSNDGLNCIACHTFQFKPGLTMPAVDLTQMNERLKPDWLVHYLLEPKRFHPGTVMPAFWPNGKAVRKDILNGDTNQQIAAIYEWLKEGRQARTPRGLIREPMELLATNEAVMLRRSYPNIGKRGIGVGYPKQVNMAFDAEQMRIAMLWKGQFIDPAGVWRSQGHGRVRPLAREQIQFQPGPELDNATSPWKADDTRPPKHQFKGYTLDKLRRPAFTYRFDDISVEDYSVDIQSKSGRPTIRRTITLSSQTSRAGLAFFIRPKDKVTPLKNGEYRIGNSLILRLTNSANPMLTESDGGQRIQIPLEVRPSAKTQLVLDYEWQ